MNTGDLRDQIRENKVILAIRGVYGDKLLKAVEIFTANGIAMIEVTFDQADEWALIRTADNIRSLKENFGDKVHVGAGTVLDEEQLNAAIEAGAEFILAPDVNSEVLEAAADKGIAAVPGALTPSEVQKAWKLGAAAVKLFPAGTMGTGYIKDLGAPLNHIPLIPMGGINAGNAAEYLALKNVIGLGAGGAVADRNLINAHDWEALDAKTKAFMDAIR